MSHLPLILAFAAVAGQLVTDAARFIIFYTRAADAAATAHENEFGTL